MSYLQILAPYGTRLIILLIQMILEVYDCSISLSWHFVGYIYDLFTAESLVRNTTPNYPTNYNICSVGKLQQLKLLTNQKEQLNMRQTKTKILFWLTTSNIHKARAK